MNSRHKSLSQKKQKKKVVSKLYAQEGDGTAETN